MFCANCGAKVEDGAKFCPKCGAAVGGAQTAGASDAAASVSATSNTGEQKGFDMSAFIEAARASKLPFVYVGDTLSGDIPQKGLSKMGMTGKAEVFIAGALSLGTQEGLSISRDGMSYCFSGSKIVEDIGITEHETGKGKGFINFAQLAPSKVTVKAGVLSTFAVEILLWDTVKGKSKTLKFGLDAVIAADDDAIQAFTQLLELLCVKFGTEYEVPNGGEDDPNAFDFTYYGGRQKGIHTHIAVTGEVLEISRFKIDEKTKIQTPLGQSTRVNISDIASIRVGRTFDIVALLRPLIAIFIAGTVVYCFIHIVGVVVFLLGIALSIYAAIPTAVIIARKGGGKLIVRAETGDEQNAKNIERLKKAVLG